MTNKYFNAKKVLMSTIAAVALSFVVTTNADAIRVKVRVKAPQSKCYCPKATAAGGKQGFLLFPQTDIWYSSIASRQGYPGNPRNLSKLLVKYLDNSKNMPIFAIEMMA